jgi:metacaspase-1
MVFMMLQEPLQARIAQLKNALIDLGASSNPHSMAFVVRIFGPQYFKFMNTAAPQLTKDEVLYGGFPSIAALGFYLGAGIIPFPDAQECIIAALKRLTARSSTGLKDLAYDDVAMLGICDGLSCVPTPDSDIESVRSFLLNAVETKQPLEDWTIRMRILASELLDPRGKLRVVPKTNDPSAIALELLLRSVWSEQFTLLPEISDDIEFDLVNHLLIDPIPKEFEKAATWLWTLDQVSAHAAFQKHEGASGFRHGFALVISDYLANVVNPLPSAVLNDAQDLASLLCDPNYCGYPNNQVILLLDKEAASKRIREELQQLSQVTSQDDTVVIYFSGHGGRTKDGKESYLIPYDYGRTKGKKSLISTKELTNLLRDINVGRLLVLLDACHSGGADLKAVGSQKIDLKLGLNEQMYETLAQGQGRVIIASSRDTETSKILPGKRNSVFTQYLLEAMRGNGYTSNDGLIRVFNIFHYVSDQVPKLVDQHPVFKADSENNFPIALELGGQKSASTQIRSRPGSINKKKLRELLSTAFTTDELEILCANITQYLSDDGILLPVNLDRVGSRGLGIEIIAHKLIEYLDQRGFLTYLIRVIKEERPSLI